LRVHWSSGGGIEDFPHLIDKFVFSIAVKGSLRLQNRSNLHETKNQIPFPIWNAINA